MPGDSDPIQRSLLHLHSILFDSTFSAPCGAPHSSGSSPRRVFRTSDAHLPNDRLPITEAIEDEGSRAHCSEERRFVLYPDPTDDGRVTE